MTGQTTAHIDAKEVSVIGTGTAGESPVTLCRMNLQASERALAFKARAVSTAGALIESSGLALFEPEEGYRIVPSSGLVQIDNNVNLVFSVSDPGDWVGFLSVAFVDEYSA